MLDVIEEHKKCLSDFESMEVIYSWTPEGFTEDQILYEDIAEEYKVVSSEKAIGGCIVYAKYHGKWRYNPWSTRALIKYLIRG